MASVQPIRAAHPEPVSLQSHAMDNLKFIRETMENAASFTAVPGWGGVAMGVTALATACVAPHPSSARAWLITWLAAALGAFALGALSIWAKARRVGTPGTSAPRHLAASLWRGSDVGGNFFRARRSGNGTLLYARRCGGNVLPCSLG